MKVPGMTKINVRLFKDDQFVVMNICRISGARHRIASEDNANAGIENMKNAAQAWNHFEKIYKPKRHASSAVFLCD